MTCFNPAVNVIRLADIGALGRRFFFPIPKEVAQGQERTRDRELQMRALDGRLEAALSALSGSLGREEQLPPAPTPILEKSEREILLLMPRFYPGLRLVGDATFRAPPGPPPSSRRPSLLAP